jgi:hypothetical protein
MRSFACFGFVALAACSSTHSSDPPPPGSYDPIPVAGSRCGAVVQQHPIEATSHVGECSPVSYTTNPPASGNHYGTWAGYGEYETPLARGFWVHNLEHGSVVVTYNCFDETCGDDLAAARAWLGSQRVDDFCLRQGSGAPRLLLTPDHELEAAWAASAWGFTLVAGCFEPAVFSDFYSAHVGQGPENICAAGSLPPDCG